MINDLTLNYPLTLNNIVKYMHICIYTCYCFSLIFSLQVSTYDGDIIRPNATLGKNIELERIPRCILLLLALFNIIVILLFFTLFRHRSSIVIIS